MKAANVVMRGQGANELVAGRLLRDERVFAGMLAQMVWKQFNNGTQSGTA